MTSIVWFRRDLRLRDNPALTKAVSLREPVLPLYIYAPEEEQPWEPGAASRWYLKRSLQELQASLQQLGLDLEFAAGPSALSLATIASRVGATKVFWNRVYEPSIIARDANVQRELESTGINAESFHDYAFVKPGSVTKADGTQYRVFTPFWRRLSGQLSALDSRYGLLTLPKIETGQRVKSQQNDIATLKIVDDHPWMQKLETHWEVGEKAALEKICLFSPKIKSYAKQRDFPAIPATSRLSAALHFGEISPWRIFSRLSQGVPATELNKELEPYIRQLGWREFAIHLLQRYPASANQSLDPRFENAGIWFYDKHAIESWQRGKTGIALVDAGMHELWETGYMQNRVRMVVGSVLTKNLGQHWIHGARWFWDTLVDADLANNTMGWQWVAGSGCDAAPYFRIFNPDTQAKKFDPQGQYLGRWLKNPSLGDPLIELASSRKSALERYAKISK